MALSVQFPIGISKAAKNQISDVIVLRKHAKDTGLTFPIPLTFSIDGGNDIITRTISKGEKGSIKERWATCDLDIYFSGIFPPKSEENHTNLQLGISQQNLVGVNQSTSAIYDMDAVERFRSYMNACALLIESDILNRLSVFRLVIEAWSLETPKAYNQPFSFQAKSDDANQNLLVDV